MRANVELGILGASAVYLAFFSWPVPKVIKDIYQTGIGRLVVLLTIAWLAKTQSIPIAILLAIAYVRFSYAAYHEGLENKETTETEEEKKKREEEEKKKKAAEAAATAVNPPPAVSGNTAASSGSSAGATANETFLNYAPVENF
jgi:hypothetical protein